MNGYYLTREEVRLLYEAIAEKKIEEALEIIYEACGDNLGLLWPAAQQRIASLRPTT